MCLPDGAVNPAFAHLGPDEGGALYTEVAGDYYLPVSARLRDDQTVPANAVALLALVAGQDVEPGDFGR